MRKVSILLAVLLLATPAFATVKIIIANEGTKAAIKYETTAGEHVRAFALDIVATGATITAVSDYKKGESTLASPGYGIFPANFARYITVGTDGEVASWDVNGYTPVADVNDPGSQPGGLGTSGLTIELGALYYPTNDTSPNAPPTSGTLCKLTVSGPCTMSAMLNAVRGGVVLTDPAVTPTVDVLTAATKVSIGILDCFPSTYSTYNDWVTLKKPDCWCAKPKGSGYQCDGDADGATETALKYRIYGNDLTIVVNNWKKKISDTTLNPCADIDHKAETALKYRVYGNDLSKVVSNWKKKDAALPGDCPRVE